MAKRSKVEATEWVGGRMALPARIEAMGERRAELTLWIELPDLKVVGQLLEDPEKPETSFAQSLMRAMAAPMVGAPRRPARVRVADTALAGQLAGVLGLDVQVAPTPEFEQVARAVAAFFGEASYFSDPLLTPQTIEQFFVAAGDLWRAAPWKQIDDDALICVESSALGITAGCLSVVGTLGEVCGFVFFPSYEDYERMTESAQRAMHGAPPLAHHGLYFSFDSEADTSETMRREVAQHAWPRSDAGSYPVLLHLVDGKHAPVLASEVALATQLMRALGAFVASHGDALSDYGETQVSVPHSTADGCDLTLSVPYPNHERARIAPRAPTCSASKNPYALPLDATKLKELERMLGAFTLHRVLGLFCAVASVPQLPPPGLWLGEILENVKPANEAQARGLMDRLMPVYQHVVTTVDNGGIDTLIPEAGDVEGCRAWAQGYTTLLGTLNPAEMDQETLRVACIIQVLAEVPEMLALLDAQRGDASRDEILAQYRESLADDADYLLEVWSEGAGAQRSKPPETIRREAPKVGRNDPCPCGSGKKHKKCCAA